MDGPLDRRGGLVRCFAEFPLLPDLLRADLESSDVPDDWARLLHEHGYNRDHVEDQDIPASMTLPEFMAQDALRLCRWIRLIDPDGDLTAAGRRLRDIAATPFADRERRESFALTRTLAVQIQQFYLGENGIPLAGVLQAASAVLASHGHLWPGGLQGLLLVEADALLHWGFADASAAQALVHRLPVVRREVLDALQWIPDAVDEHGVVVPEVAAETLAEVHWSRAELARDSELTITELRATAMAMTFAQLLSQTLMSLPLQVLRPWVPPDYGR